MKQMPKIEKYMTPMPQTINADLPLKRAIQMMTDHGFRHLPVQVGGKLVGILTDRDVKLASIFTQAETLKVEDVMSLEVYAVPPGTALNHVVETMAERKYGCAVVQQENDKVVGIFTAVDGLRTFAELLENNYKEA
jgi:acetoin utilization protein AcuB